MEKTTSSAKHKTHDKPTHMKTLITNNKDINKTQNARQRKNMKQPIAKHNNKTDNKTTKNIYAQTN